MAIAESASPLATPAAQRAAGPAMPAGTTDAEQRGGRLRVYVWQVPVRLTHWLTVATIMVLSVTGAYIADPFLIPPGGSVMTSVRFIHMVAAFTFLASGVIRTYWLFVGNRFSRWSAFLPVTRRQLSEMARQTGWYLFLRRDLPSVLGHNALAAGTYIVVFFLFLVQTVTGFALEAQHGGGFPADLFGWVAGVFGVTAVRVVHHLVMWGVLAFMIHHVYSALLVDHWEKNGLMSSIFSGFKFVTRRDIQAARDGGIAVEELAE